MGLCLAGESECDVARNVFSTGLELRFQTVRARWVVKTEFISWCQRMLLCHQTAWGLLGNAVATVRNCT